MNQMEYISAVSSATHEAVESWARDLLQEAGIETTEVYGQFPPEGSVASHIVLFPYRMGPGDAQLSIPVKETSLVGPRAAALNSPAIPPIWKKVGAGITSCIMEQFPRITKGPHAGRPHPAPLLDGVPEPLRKWYKKQKDQGGEDAWKTVLDDKEYARLPSLAWKSGVSMKIQYLVVVGEGARGTSERSAPISIQALSVLTAGAQLQKTLDVLVPPAPFDPKLTPFIKALAQCLDKEEGDYLLSALPALKKKLRMQVTLLPGAALTNADFTGLMQALQRPLQPTLHLAVQLSLGGGPVFAPGITANVVSDRKERRPSGRM